MIIDPCLLHQAVRNVDDIMRPYGLASPRLQRSVVDFISFFLNTINCCKMLVYVLFIRDVSSIRVTMLLHSLDKNNILQTCCTMKTGFLHANS